MSQPTPPESVEGQKSRRLACDRCRGQKLKCVREGASETCQRCEAAKATCTFGRPLPPGRPSMTRPAVQDMRVDPPEPAPTVTFPRADAEDHRLPTIKPSAESRGFPKRTWDPATSTEADNFFNLLYEDAGDVDLGEAMFDTWTTATADVLDDASSWHAMASSSEIGGDHLLGANAAISTTSVDRRSQLHIQRQSVDSIAQETASKHRRMSEMNRSASHTSIPPTGMLGNAGSAPHPPGVMQKLMELSCVMYDLECRYLPQSEGSQPVPPAYDSFPTQLAGQVLQAAIDFQRFLQQFFAHDSPPMTRQRDPSLSDLSDMDDGSGRGALGSYPSSYVPIPRPPFVYSSSSSPERPSSQQVSTADKPTSLQLIINYMRLLQLYLLLHNAIYDYVRLTPTATRQRQPIWSDLVLGGAILDQFADMQIKFVLQVATRLLEDIETALGLTEGCRVGKRTPAERSRRGILGMHVTTHFIEMCMSEATTGRGDHGRGAIVRLRDIMYRLSEMLDTPAMA